MREMSTVEDPPFGIAELSEEKPEPDGDVRDVWKGGKEHAAGLQPAANQAEEPLAISKVLDHVRADDGVEGRVPAARVKGVRLAPVVVAFPGRHGIRRGRLGARQGGGGGGGGS